MRIIIHSNPHWPAELCWHLSNMMDIEPDIITEVTLGLLLFCKTSSRWRRNPSSCERPILEGEKRLWGLAHKTQMGLLILTSHRKECLHFGSTGALEWSSFCCSCFLVIFSLVIMGSIFVFIGHCHTLKMVDYRLVAKRLTLGPGLCPAPQMSQSLSSTPWHPHCGTG